jgi:hypothetical protein
VTCSAEAVRAGRLGSAAPLLRGRQHLHATGELGQLGAVPAQRDRDLDDDPLTARDLEGEDLGAAARRRRACRRQGGQRGADLAAGAIGNRLGRGGASGSSGT